jgi:hypothetical protein
MLEVRSALLKGTICGVKLAFKRDCRFIVLLSVALFGSIFIWPLRSDDLSKLSTADVEKLANGGDPVAQDEMGIRYGNGQGVPQDYKQALAWCLKAGLQGNLKAELNLGWLYCNGAGTEKNYQLSTAWYLKAAQQGDADATFMIAVAYEEGRGVKADPVKALDWLRKAASAGNMDASAQLGIDYLYGKTVKVDSRKAFIYLLDASAANPYAAFNIAICYRNGIFVSADPIQAYRWCLIAQQVGQCNEAAALMKQLQASLTPADIEKAKNLVAVFFSLAKGEYQTADFKATFTSGSSAVFSYNWDLSEILVPVILNGHKAESVVDPVFASVCGLKAEDYVPVKGTGEEMELAQIAEPSTMTLPGIVFDHVRLEILSTGMAPYLGRPLDGIIGMDVLKNLIIHIDYADKTIEIMSPDLFKPQMGDEDVLALLPGAPVPTVEGKLANDGVESGAESFVVDTGSIGSVSVGMGFQQRNPLLKLRAAVKSGAAGLGGEITTWHGFCSELSMGDIKLPNPPVDFDQSTQNILSGSSGGAIGNEIWKRFDVTIDFPDSKLFLRKNQNFDDPYPDPDEGFWVKGEGPNYDILTVVEVFPQSAASRAGFQKGDIIEQVFEKPGAKLTMSMIYSLLETKGTYHVEVDRQGKSLVLVFDTATTGRLDANQNQNKAVQK